MGYATALYHPPRFGLFALMILGFIFFWPVGVVTLAFLIGSGRMGCGHYGHWGAERWQERMAMKRARWEERWAQHQGHHGHNARPTGNRAFDEYRAETLRRLEDEEKEFREFLDRLRFAKDKAEFDDFLANRRPPAPPAVPEEPLAS
jgi:hypothetical protein